MTRKEKAMMIADYAHYIQRHAEYETALLYSIRDKNRLARGQAIIKARWAATEAVRAAKRLGIYPDYVQSSVLDRAQSTGLEA